MNEYDEEVKRKYEEIRTRLMELIKMIKESDEDDDDPNIYFA